jgi:hypothetical protein
MPESVWYSIAQCSTKNNSTTIVCLYELCDRLIVGHSTRHEQYRQEQFVYLLDM